MNKTLFLLEKLFEPQILHTADSYLLLYKPPGMHSAPGKGENNMAAWCAEKFPEILDIKGRREGEGGLVHRLDYETHGLLLFARNQDAFEKLIAFQNDNQLIKEYDALSAGNGEKLPGFPPYDFGEIPRGEKQEPLIIESFFRPYGKGRKQVRPVPLESAQAGIKNPDGRKCYKTEITEGRRINSPGGEDFFSFRLRLSRGFRHQIRCHLAWLGFPVKGDPLYGAYKAGGTESYLALRAGALRFIDPASKEERYFCLPPLSLTAEKLPACADS